MVSRLLTFRKQLISLFYSVLMLEKEVKWWSLLSALIIYCHCLQRLVDSLKFVNTECDNYRLTLNALSCMLLATNNLENIMAEES